MKKYLNVIYSLWVNCLNLIYPRTCLSCGDELVSGEESVCLTCLVQLPPADMLQSPGQNLLMDKFIGKVAISGAAAIFWFDKGSPLQALVHALKYKRKPELGISLGRVMGAELKQHTQFPRMDYLIPVPLHPGRRKRRGYNQAEQLARGISEVCTIPVVPDALIRTRNNVSQTGKTREERWENVRKIFQCKQKLSGNVMLIDDVITTGSTLEACIAVLNDAGIDQVYVLSLAAARIRG